MNRLELLRYERGLTRRDVSEGSGVPERTVRHVEREAHRPSPKTAKALADFYEITVAELLGVDERSAA